MVFSPEKSLVGEMQWAQLSVSDSEMKGWSQGSHICVTNIIVLGSGCAALQNPDRFLLFFSFSLL
jgi:hypothetical protein